MQRRKTSFHTKPRKPLKRSGFKKRKTTKKKITKRSKLPNVKTVRNKADKLLTPIVKELHPYCFLQMSENCERVTQVAHHHILKSKCTALRYEIDNLIPLCHRCHMLLHSHETYYSSIIVERKGVAWFRKLEKRKNEIIKADVHFYIENHARLEKILQQLQTGSYPQE